jgi:hypothetical protein
MSRQAKTQMIQLIELRQRHDLRDWDRDDRWVRASYEALRFDAMRQEKFGEYCCTSRYSTSARVCPPVRMLKQVLLGENCALNEEFLEERLVPWEH